MSSKIWLSLGASITLLAACATQQENPNYAYSTKYKAGSQTSSIQTSPVSYQSGATTTYASASTASEAYSRTDQDCLRRETNYQLLGAGLGGTAGAFAGNELIGGTAGTVAGAGLGGALGYGVGNFAVNCDPQTVVAQQPAPTRTAYQSSTPSYSTGQPTISSASTYQTPANYQSVSSDQSRVVYQSPRIEYQPSLADYQSQIVQQQAENQAPTSVVQQAPTDAQFENISEGGTPGYQVLQSQVIAYDAPIAVAEAPRIVQSSSGAQVVDYDYSENIVSANTFTTPEYSETRIIGGSGYSVHSIIEGDTVYSLARRNCVGVNDIQSINGLNSNFAIKIGDSLKLPASQC